MAISEYILMKFTVIEWHISEEFYYSVQLFSSNQTKLQPDLAQFQSTVYNKKRNKCTFDFWIFKQDIHSNYIDACLADAAPTTTASALHLPGIILCYRDLVHSIWSMSMVRQHHSNHLCSLCTLQCYH